MEASDLKRLKELEDEIKNYKPPQKLKRFLEFKI